MAHYNASVDTPRPLEEVFAYLSDFSTTAHWDPGVVDAERVDGGPLGEGSQFRLRAAFFGREVPLTYRIVGYDPPRSVTLRGENATVVSLDRITVSPLGDGAQVTYDADLSLKGALKVADPLLAVLFRRVGDRALAGLRRTLAGELHAADRV